ncbi:hypothetical protein M8J76_000089 [Diaphorina citri]|nr:hypothetical protein M8J75_000480 [Diaphorina citri]KAI5721859.1 hypothetical protein M8J76_000089 [Diaphorina citri]
MTQDVLQSAWKVSLQEEMATDPAIKQEDIDQVVQWCRQQTYLPPVSENTVALFLKLSDYNVEKAQTFIDNHYTFRTYYRNIFGDRDPTNADCKLAMNAINAFILPGMTQDRRRVIFASLKSPPDSSRFTASSGLKYLYMTLEMDILDAGFGDSDGYSVLFDARGFGLGHLTTISISFLKQLFSYFLDGANMAIREINIINVNAVVEKLIMMIRSLAPRDLHERIKLYTKDKTEACLAKYPVDILPKELEGNPKLILQEMTESNEKKIIALRSWYLADEKYLRVDESKRPLDKQNKKVIKLQASLQKIELD